MLAGARAEDGQLVVGAASYRALILSDWHVAHPDELAAVVQLLAAGVPVVVLGALPARARGLVDAAARDAQIAADAAAVRAAAQVVDEDDELAAALAAEGVLPLLSVRSGDCTTVSTAHRELAEGPRAPAAGRRSHRGPRREPRAALVGGALTQRPARGGPPLPQGPVAHTVRACRGTWG
ncbi:MAG: hypothetical protein IPL19_08900 [Sandaracinaceae bacterium]|nr:hypothetical protein [Sandaracinaceae bacterium]